MSSAAQRLPGSPRGTLVIMAIACGAMVANIYMCQPLLADIARSFGVSAGSASLVAVLTQVGYSLGILFVVPLSDVADRRKLLRALFVLSALGLLGAALAPRIEVLQLASLLVAATSVVAQVLIPIATTLTTPEFRGRVVATLSTGLILGILLARTLAGIEAEMFGTWRAAFLIQAALVVVLLLVVPRFVPERIDRPKLAYGDLLRSLPSLLRLPALRLSAGLSFLTFAAFSAIWSTVVFHVSHEPFNAGAKAAGMLGLYAAPGALLAPVVGRLADKLGPTRINAVSLVAALISAGCAATWGASSMLGLVLAMNLLDFGQQSGQVANQTRIFGAGAELRGRLNTLYMLATFSGGALGALLGSVAWAHGGWQGACALAGSLVSLALVLLAASRLVAARAPRGLME